MNFTISCETYVRLAGVTNKMPDNVTDDEKAYLRCVRLERKDGQTYALASNRKVAAIYYLGKTDGADSICHLVIDDTLIKQCEAEKPFNSSLSVTVIAELQMASVKTTLGYNHPGNAAIFPASTPLNDWRKWGPGEPVKTSSGAMAWHLEHLIALNKASPSGTIVFPEFIDAMKPVLVRDLKDENWAGLFMVRRVDDADNPFTADPATVPAWFK